MTKGLIFFLSLLLCSPFLSQAEKNQVEIQALTSFKLNLYDPLGALNWWDPSTPAAPCDWQGVACSNNRVTELRLPQLQLSGRLTDRLSDLKCLTRLSLHSNSFNGTIPSTLSQCKLLRAVFLQYNSITGTLPSGLSNLIDLAVLNLAQNHLSGEISGDLPWNIKYLDLSSNSFSGFTIVGDPHGCLAPSVCPGFFTSCGSLKNIAVQIVDLEMYTL